MLTNNLTVKHFVQFLLLSNIKKINCTHPLDNSRPEEDEIKKRDNHRASVSCVAGTGLSGF